MRPVANSRALSVGRVAARRITMLAACAVLAGTAMACGPTNPSPSGAVSETLVPASPAAAVGSPGVVASSSLTPDEATAAYGLGPTRDPSVTYQPDVVLVEGGPAIVRWASADGLTWAIDPNAPGALDLKVGSVMFATSAAMGRVAAIEDQGDSRVVTIAPIQLTDLVRDASLQYDTPVDFASTVYQPLPTDAPAIVPDDASPSPSPAADVVGADGTTTVELPPIRLAALSRNTSTPTASVAPAAFDPTVGGRLTAPLKICPELGVGDWAVEACAQGQGVTLNVDRKAGDHLKFGFTVKLSSTNLRVQAGEVVKDGQMVDSGGVLQGLDALDVTFHGGVQDGAQDNTKIKIEVPVEIETPSVVVGGIPLKGLIEFKFSLETAFSGKNSTLSGSGTYKLTGPIGVTGGKPVVPGLSVVHSLMDSLSGITLGVSGVVFTVRAKFQGGIGVYGFIVGPYVTFTFSFGIGQGSVIGAALAECRGVTLGLWTGVGAGFSLNPKKMAWLINKDSVLGKYLNIKLEEDILQFQIFNRKSVQPDVPLCRG